VSGNKTELEDLKAKLVTITAIVQSYKKQNGLRALDHRITMFCECVGSSFILVIILHLPIIYRAIVLQLNMVEKLHDNPLWIRTVESTNDFDTILKAFRNISSLCEVFQVSFLNDWPPRVCIEQFVKIDTQLNIEATAEDILQVMSLRREI